MERVERFVEVDAEGGGASRLELVEDLRFPFLLEVVVTFAGEDRTILLVFLLGFSSSSLSISSSISISISNSCNSILSSSLSSLFHLASLSLSTNSLLLSSLLLNSSAIPVACPDPSRREELAVVVGRRP